MALVQVACLFQGNEGQGRSAGEDQWYGVVVERQDARRLSASVYARRADARGHSGQAV